MRIDSPPRTGTLPVYGEADPIARLPKVELHLHLEGALRPETMCELARRADPSSHIGEPAWIEQTYRFSDLSDFIAKVRPALDVCLRGVEDYYRVAYELFVDLAAQNVRYAEVSFGPERVLRYGIPMEEQMEALFAAKRRAESEHAIHLGLVVGLGRRSTGPTAVEIVRQAAAAQDRGIVGIDLHGDEQVAPPEQFAAAFALAREAGLGLRAHAGEGAGPTSVWGAIHALGVSRIAHGVRAIEDPALVEFLRQSPITLDLCPTSNLKLGVVSSLVAHPIRGLFDLGIRVTVNSDDPLFFQTTISKEYQILQQQLGFTDRELRQITLYAVEGAFLPEKKKAALRHEIERCFSESILRPNR